MASDKNTTENIDLHVTQNDMTPVPLLLTTIYKLTKNDTTNKIVYVFRKQLHSNS